MTDTAASSTGAMSTVKDGAILRFMLSGDWIIDHASFIEKQIDKIIINGRQPTVVDCSGLGRLDTAGAVLLRRLTIALSPAGPVTRKGLSTSYDHLLKMVEGNFKQAKCAPEPPNWLMQAVGDIGETMIDVAISISEMLSFLGNVLSSIARMIWQPKRFRLNALVTQIEMVGVRSLGIVGLISFLIGAVMVNQGSIQLQKFGAEIYVIDMLGVGHLREMGILLTAIIIAGRSGSAFTAQIGSMQLYEEVDAMKTLGMRPIDVLVVPRFLALIICMPLLTVFADVIGLTGGALMAWLQLDISLANFVVYFQEEVHPNHFWVGMIKAPFFGAVIALSGCFQGLCVHGSADSLGRHTTKSVVQSIFMVIILDAMFAIFFTSIDM